MNIFYKSIAIAVALNLQNSMLDDQCAYAQQLVHYSGNTMSDPNSHDGRLSPVMGVHNIQIMCANREHPSVENGMGWTYNHQPMMAYWNGKFYVHYLCDEKDEQVPPSHTLLQTSVDGYTWSNPEMLFPEYKVPEGFKKEGVEGEAHNLVAVMHQRQGFYVSKSGHLFAMGTYGICLNKKDHNNDGNGIGRVIREIKKDGKLGPIYFIYYNHGFNAGNTDYPYYKKGNKEMRKACEEILANPRMLMGWVEEADRNDSIIPLSKPYKAYNDYTLPDGSIVALWKHALTSVSKDGGKTWLEPVNRAKGFVNSNAKIWGQRLSDGTYATIYNPSEFRWPLAISLSGDGLNYTTLNLVNGEVPPMRYGGNYKSFGPQYVRGILEGNGVPKDSDLWVTYSINKEDMWVSHIPVPVMTEAHAHANDDFSKVASLHDLNTWNIYSPKMASVSLENQWLVLKDEDPFDYARVERKIPSTKELDVEFDIEAEQNKNGLLQIEFLDKNGVAASRIDLTPEGIMQAKSGARYGKITTYEPGKTYHVKINLSVANRTATFFIDGKQKTKRIFFAPVEAFERIAFRTGERRSFPTVDTPADWDGILPNAGERETMAIYKIANFKTSAADSISDAAFLKADSYKHYVDYFNSMEDENIAQAIPNAESWDWMKANVPLFDAPDKAFEQMWYYRWWTLRKHIENTSVGYAMTEFLVRRSYADKYNLIASALGHHIHESRWLRNPVYLDQIINTWLHGNKGEMMKKINFYSSWLAASVWDKYLVDGDQQKVVSLLPDLLKENKLWDNHRWNSEYSIQNGQSAKEPTSKSSSSNLVLKEGASSLYWQYDVRDAMEETISGGRREKNARPSINSYMYGNSRAIANIATLAGDKETAALYNLKADTLQQMVQQKLWNDSSKFFEVRYPNQQFANVREEIGFIPWYFKLPVDNQKYAEAWLQLSDEKGFNAPFGITTAERRHPKFRSHGSGTCEWDGAIWPFATSQTLTAYANFLNDYPKGLQAVEEALASADKGNAKADKKSAKNNPKSEANSILEKARGEYFSQLSKFVGSQSFHGKPYIGEYLDEVTGYWLKGEADRSRYYNHSTFNDLVITGLCGLRPRQDNVIEVNPLLPADKWNYFCLDNISYHGKNLTILWDKDGSRYHAGKGLSVWVNGVKIASRSDIGRIEVAL